MGAHAVRLSNVEIDNALKNRDFEVLFQPIFDLGNGAFARVESFVRWRHASLGVLPPGAFISFFETQGRMGELTRYVMAEAVDAYLDWRGPYAPGFSINLALSDLVDADFAAGFADVMRARGFPPEYVTLECPMPPVDADGAAIAEGLSRLSQTGARLAIEVRGRANDFLRAASPFPFAEIKTGGAAILRFARTVRGPGLSAISELLELANANNSAITAVGVEDEASLTALKGLGFAAAQGNLLGKVGELKSFTPSRVNDVRALLGLEPLSADDLAALFRTGAPHVKPANDAPEAAAATKSKASPTTSGAGGSRRRASAASPSAPATDDDLIRRLSDRIRKSPGATPPAASRDEASRQRLARARRAVAAANARRKKRAEEATETAPAAQKAVKEPAPEAAAPTSATTPPDAADGETRGAPKALQDRLQREFEEMSRSGSFVEPSSSADEDRDTTSPQTPAAPVVETPVTDDVAHDVTDEDAAGPVDVAADEPANAPSAASQDLDLEDEDDEGAGGTADKLANASALSAAVLDGLGGGRPNDAKTPFEPDAADGVDALFGIEPADEDASDDDDAETADADFAETESHDDTVDAPATAEENEDTAKFDPADDEANVEFDQPEALETPSVEENASLPDDARREAQASENPDTKENEPADDNPIGAPEAASDADLDDAPSSPETAHTVVDASDVPSSEAPADAPSADMTEEEAAELEEAVARAAAHHGVDDPFQGGFSFGPAVRSAFVSASLAVGAVSARFIPVLTVSNPAFDPARTALRNAARALGLDMDAPPQATAADAAAEHEADDDVSAPMDQAAIETAPDVEPPHVDAERVAPTSPERRALVTPPAPTEAERALRDRLSEAQDVDSVDAPSGEAALAERLRQPHKTRRNFLTRKYKIRMSGHFWPRPMRRAFARAREQDAADA